MQSKLGSTSSQMKALYLFSSFFHLNFTSSGREFDFAGKVPTMLGLKSPMRCSRSCRRFSSNSPALVPGRRTRRGMRTQLEQSSGKRLKSQSWYAKGLREKLTKSPISSKRHLLNATAETGFGLQKCMNQLDYKMH